MPSRPQRLPGGCGSQPPSQTDRIRPRDLDRLRSSGTIAPALVPLVEIAEAETKELTSLLEDATEPVVAQSFSQDVGHANDVLGVR